MTLPLFVYGTLMSDGARAAMLAGLGRRPLAVRGKLYAMPAGYPALVLGGDALVHGELVDAPDERRLGVLDLYEGVGDGLYERVQIDVVVGLRSVAAWTYVMHAPEKRGGVPIPSGRWRAIRQR